ncbi:MAG: hypothetical protein BMS9Abin36_0617 [Gammaproteobacteria bacterium]|nr:MAG: hypothetical protein BMS9Abin36_0617 [Gammaproteobacteria bacterium]
MAGKVSYLTSLGLLVYMILDGPYCNIIWQLLTILCYHHDMRILLTQDISIAIIACSVIYININKKEVSFIDCAIATGTLQHIYYTKR